MSSVPANPLLDWPPALSVEEALAQVKLARSFLVRMQEAVATGRLEIDSRPYISAAHNVRLRVRRALELGAKETDVLAAAASAYRSDLCSKCGCIFYTRTEDERFRGVCGECLYE
ncbi:MAG TPA: hypothetical protein VGW38_07580 [Chloroflexota bacterium]|nr:hypothetical protein [Chloroflexota bacterium]